MKSEPLMAMMTLIIIIKMWERAAARSRPPFPACGRGAGGEGKEISNIECSILNVQVFLQRTTDNGPRTIILQEIT